MPYVHDIVLAKPTERDRVFKKAGHLKAYRCVANAGISIDDVVHLLALHRGVVDDRKQRFALRREVYSSFKEDDRDVNRHISLLSAEIRDEVAGISDSDVTGLAERWSEPDAPTSSQVLGLVAACREARDDSLGVMLKSYNIDNAFQQAIAKLPRDERAEFTAAFESWDAETQQSAHEKCAFLELIGQTDCLEAVRDEVEHGEPHCATFLLLAALRKTAEAAINRGVDGLDYLDQMSPETNEALSEFKTQLSEENQARVLQAFSVTLLSDLMDVVEGDASGFPPAPSGWTLVATDNNGAQIGTLGEFHAYYDADDEFWPKVES